MKNISLLAFAILVSNFEVKSQNLELAYGFGSGAAYIFENADVGVDISYALPFSSFVDFKYSSPDSYFGAKIRIQCLNAGLKGKTGKALMKKWMVMFRRFLL